jgi:hypothetical protein
MIEWYAWVCQVDEPSFTQPVMYKEVRRAERPSPAQGYAAQLMQEGLLTPDRMQVRGYSHAAFTPCKPFDCAYQFGAMM